MLSPAELEVLRAIPVRVTAKLDCPDCGAPMRLVLGKFGRFYGCSKYKVTGCKGGVSARPDGMPLATPGDLYTRRLRKQLVTHLEHLRETEGKPKADLVWENLCSNVWGDLFPGVGALNAAQCEAGLKHLGIPFQQRGKSIWDRLKE